MRHHALCSIIPPHILRNIAERGDDAARAAANATLDISAHTRGARVVIGTIRTAGTVPAGEKRRTVYDTRGTRKLAGKLIRGEKDGAVRDIAVNEAYEGAGKTYDFFRKAFDRNSVDDCGLRLDATVHYGSRYCNAMWNGRQMIYGDGDSRYFNRFTIALDVIAHELTHAVTQYSAALEYDGEAGALNEHFSDVFGVLTKQYALRQSTAKADWLVGAGIFTPHVHGAAIRSMKSPGSAYDDPIMGKDPQPEHMRDYIDTDADNGGVHVNSGIPNRAFYEVASLLGGRAWDVPGKIWYRTLTHGLRASATFQHCANATWRSAGELFGAGSAPQHAVLAAWKKVGIRISASVAERGPRFDLPAGAAEVPQMVPRERPQV
jgi:Zn-dependent metalloprotease